MSTLYIHLGLPKCGTTSLQTGLYANADALRDLGVAYPVFTPGDPFHHSLVFALRDGDGARVQACSDALQACAGGAVVLSSENFFWESRQVSPQAVHRLFADSFDHIRIVVYLRNIYAYFNSWYAEHVQSWENRGIEPAEVFFDPPRIEMARYPVFLRAWADVFGADNMILRLFDRHSLVGGDILDDFLDVLGVVPPQPLCHPEGDENISLGFYGITLMRALNAGQPDRAVAAHQRLRDAVAAQGTGQGSGAPRMVLPAQVLAQITAQHGPDQQALATLTGPQMAARIYALPPPDQQPNRDDFAAAEAWATGLLQSGFPGFS